MKKTLLTTLLLLCCLILSKSHYETNVSLFTSKNRIVENTENINLFILNSDFANKYYGLTGEDITVAVIDIGIDTNNKELKRNVMKSFDCTSGKECKEESSAPNSSHGTMVAGLITSKSYGVAENVNLINFNVQDLEDENKLNRDGLVLAYKKILDLKTSGVNIDIVNMSYGDPTEIMQDIEGVLLKSLNDSGIMLVAATGNFGNDPEKKDVVYFPAGYDFTIAVGILKMI